MHMMMKGENLKLNECLYARLVRKAVCFTNYMSTKSVYKTACEGLKEA